MVTLLVGFVIAVSLTPAIRWLLVRAELIDVPNERSSHARPVPRGGGLAVAAAASFAVLVGDRSTVTLTIVIGAVVLGAVGMVDDRVSLHTTPRLIAQVLVPAGSMVWLLAGSELTTAPKAAVAVLGVGWCAGYVNAFNFMDGINGISAAQAATVGATLAAIGAHVDDDAVLAAGLAVAGAVLGFAVYNVLGMIFLGDVGSYFLGYWLASSALVAVARQVPIEVVVAPFVLYLVDTSTTLVRRWRRGAPIREAHREHAYQRLHQLGWSHVAVSSLVAIVTAASGVIGVLLVDSAVAARLAGLAVAIVLASGFVMLPDALGRRVSP